MKWLQTNINISSYGNLRDKRKNSNLTLNVENASDATSKLGNSTYLKNNTKLADSNMYLRTPKKIRKLKKCN